MSWNHSPLPLVAAPMAGGPTTPALVRAVSGAGGFAFLAGGYLDAAALERQLDEVAAEVPRFGVNLFVPDDRPADADALARYAAAIQPEATPYDLALEPRPVADDDHYPEKVELLLRRPVAVVSFTFALPSPETVRALREVGTLTYATVTTAQEARAARGTGVDGLVVQGPSAGGHSATLDPARDPGTVGTAALVREVRGAVDLPVIATGGVDGPDAVAELLAAGADAVAVGTLLLRTPEAGTSPTHRAALGSPEFTETVITRAFTGRPARALRNAFIDRHEAHAPVAYPAVHHLTRPLRQAAAAAGDASRVHLWAGTGWRSARPVGAAEVVADLRSATE